MKIDHPSDRGTTLPELMIVIFITAILGLVVMAGITITGRIITSQLELHEQKVGVNQAISTIESHISSNDSTGTNAMVVASPSRLKIKSFSGVGLVNPANNRKTRSSFREYWVDAATRTFKERVAGGTPRTLVNGLKGASLHGVFTYYEMNDSAGSTGCLREIGSSRRQLSAADINRVSAIGVKIIVNDSSNTQNKFDSEGTRIIPINKVSSVSAQPSKIDFAKCWE